MHQFALLLAFALQIQPPANPVSTQQDVRFATVQGVDLHFDVYRSSTPSPTPQPAVILIHGGGWTSFDKSTMRTMGEFLARHGYVAFAVDYRLFHEGQNRWPAQLEDVQQAVRWIRANAAKYNVDPTRIGAFGHSAGAQLAALLGMEDTPSKVQAVVDVSGPTDFTTTGDAEDKAFLNSFFGPNPELWRAASPLFQVAKDNAPFLILHGTKDENVPIEQSEKLYNKLTAAGVPVSFFKVDDVHTFRTPEARRKLAIETLRFFNTYLAPAATPPTEPRP